MKGQKGITLIALILTVLVLIVLAAVVLYSIEHNRIVAYTESAKTEYTDEQDNENQVINALPEGVFGGSNSGSGSNSVSGSNSGNGTNNTQSYNVYATLVAYGDLNRQIQFSTDNGATWTDVKNIVGNQELTEEKITLSSNVSQIKFKISDGSGSVISVGYQGVSDVYSLNQSVTSGGLETENITLTQDMYVELRVGDGSLIGPWLPID